MQNMEWTSVFEEAPQTRREFEPHIERWPHFQNKF